MDSETRLNIIRNVRRMIKNRVKNEPNWIMVMHIFGTGSTSAYRICVDCRIDPDGMDA
jgi:hypothetical protein